MFITLEEGGANPPTEVQQTQIRKALGTSSGAKVDAMEATAVSWRSTISGLSGGSATDLDGIPTEGLAAGYLLLMSDGGLLRFYRLKAGTDATDLPAKVRPADYAPTSNEKFWELEGAAPASVESPTGFFYGTVTAGAPPYTTDLTDAATISWDTRSQGMVQRVTLSGNRSLGSIILDRSQARCTALLQVVQDVAGGHTLSFIPGVKWPGGTFTGLSTAANAVDLVTFVTYDGGITWYAAIQKGFA